LGKRQMHKNKIYLVDTNVVLRYLLDDHEIFSPKAKRFMIRLSDNAISSEISAVVIVECVYVMEKFYKIPRNEIVNKLCAILSFSGIVNADKKNLIAALIEYGRTNVDIVDCILAAESSSTRIVVSFDKDFKKLNCVCKQL
jgi:uncharacterized protein